MIPPLGLATVFTLHLFSPPTPNTNTKGYAWWYGPRGRAASTRAPASCKTLSCWALSKLAAFVPCHSACRLELFLSVVLLPESKRPTRCSALFFSCLFLGGVGWGREELYIRVYEIQPFAFYFLNIYFFFACAGSLLLCKLSSSCREWGLLPSCSRQLFIVVASLVAELGF